MNKNDKEPHEVFTDAVDSTIGVARKACDTATNVAQTGAKVVGGEVQKQIDMPLTDRVEGATGAVTTLARAAMKLPLPIAIPKLVALSVKTAVVGAAVGPERVKQASDAIGKAENTLTEGAKSLFKGRAVEAEQPSADVEPENPNEAPKFLSKDI